MCWPSHPDVEVRRRLLAAGRAGNRPTSTSSTTSAPPRPWPPGSPSGWPRSTPRHADDYRANAEEFGRQADTIASSERAIAQAHPGASVVATEPVAYYLLRNAGVTDRTPQGFAAAVEEGDDPAPADVATMLDLINSHQVAALLFNPQTETAATQQIEAAARRASVPVVNVTETLPEGLDYLTWQARTVEELAHQLDQAPRAR